MIDSGLYERMFARNIYYLAFYDIENLRSNVLNDIDEFTQDNIYNDEVYGLNTPQKLYKWIRVMNGGEESGPYTDI